mmetsp:Transcript_38625/g.66300  ORF Transcript_38625/g.66300 Transcript_38625/m.66300 type:complete len:103 (-) Transcript_38625:678-986(-)
MKGKGLPHHPCSFAGRIPILSFDEVGNDGGDGGDGEPLHLGNDGQRLFVLVWLEGGLVRPRGRRLGVVGAKGGEQRRLAQGAEIEWRYQGRVDRKAERTGAE